MLKIHHIISTSLLLCNPNIIIINAFQTPIPHTHTTKTTTSTSTHLHSRSTSTSTSSKTYDLTIIGGGPAGVKAALLAASAPFFKKVCLIDAPRASGALMNEETGEDLSIGGPTGLFSKALRDTSKRISVRTLRGMGLREDSVWNEIINACVDLASSNAKDVLRQLSYAEVDYKQSFASFPDSGETTSLFLTDSQQSSSMFGTLDTKNVLIATGSQPFRPRGIPFDGKRVFDSDSINTLSRLPKSIVITGSGIIAVEFAKIFRNLGADVTLIIRDLVPRNALMRIGFDKDVAATLVADLARSGIRIERGAQVSSFDIPSNPQAPLKLTLEGPNGKPRPSGAKTELKCDIYLAAVGRKPNTSNLNLGGTGIKLDEYGGIKVDCDMRTTVENVYAAGDVVGRPFLASTGVLQAASAVRSMFADVETPSTSTTEEVVVGADCESNKIQQIKQTIGGIKFDPESLASDPFAFPVGIWSSPEASYYGLTLDHAIELNIDAGEGMALYAECLRGLVFSPNGLLKLVYEKSTGRILGVHICGDDACELIHYGMELVKGKRTLTDVIDSLYSAVTFHEMYRIAAMAALDQDGARKRRRNVGKALSLRQRNSVS